MVGHTLSMSCIDVLGEQSLLNPLGEDLEASCLRLPPKPPTLLSVSLPLADSDL